MNIRQLLRYARPYRASLLLASSLTCASSLLLLAIPWFAAKVLASTVSGAAAPNAAVVGLLLACLLGIAALNFVVAFNSASTSARLLADLRLRVYERVERLPMPFHEAGGDGDTLALMTYEIYKLGDFLTGTLVSIPSRLLTTVGAIVLMFRIDQRLALVVPLVIPAFYLILKIIGRRLRGLALEFQEAEANVVTSAEQMLETLPAIKAFTREKPEAHRYQAALTRAAGLAIKQGRIYAALDPIVTLIAALVAVFILLLAGAGVRSGEMSSSELFSFIFYAALLTRPVGALAHIYGQVQSARGTLQRLQSVFDEPMESIGGGAEPGWRASGAIQFRNIGFAYPERKATLRNLDLDVAAGEIVALTGANGAGKTAMINLLMRFHEPQEGTITLDGQDIRKIALQDLRRQIGLVPQLPILFNGTIRDNIAFGAIAPSDAEIEKAARDGQAFEFIDALPSRMNTVIGDRGVRLSGGQRQRIALSRALIKDPPILIFDEATSMFDEEGEAGFIAACSAALANRTVILVTHRPATLSLASRVFVLERGRVDGRTISGDRAAKAGQAKAFQRIQNR